MGGSNEKISQDVIRVLKQFNQQSKLKKAITKTLAAHMGDEPQKKIREHFKRLDKNGDGALSADELSFLLRDMGHNPAFAKQQAEEIIKQSDDDGSGEIEFEEFAQIWQRKLLTVNQSYIHAVFTVLDENGDGSIDADELAKVLEVNDQQKIEAYIKEVDTDRNGKISFEEFRRAMLELESDAEISNTKNNVGHAMDIEDFENHDAGDVSH